MDWCHRKGRQGPGLMLPGAAPLPGHSPGCAALRTALWSVLTGGRIIINCRRGWANGSKGAGPGRPHFLLVPQGPARTQVRACSPSAPGH